MALKCVKCYRENPPTAYFCMACGTAVPRAPAGESTRGWNHESLDECAKCGFKNALESDKDRYFLVGSFCQACGEMLPREIERRRAEDGLRSHWAEKYRLVKIELTDAILGKIKMQIQAGHTPVLTCPFCDARFSEGRAADYEISHNVRTDFLVDGDNLDALVKRFSDPVFMLKMHLILLHDNPSEIEIDRTSETYWKDVLGYMDMTSGESNRILLWEIMRAYRELGETRPKG